MIKRYFIHSTQYRTFFASMLAGTRSRIEKTADVITRLEDDAAQALLKSASYQNESRDSAAIKKQLKALTLAEQWRIINNKQRELLALILAVDGEATTEPKIATTDEIEENLV